MFEAGVWTENLEKHGNHNSNFLQNTDSRLAMVREKFQRPVATILIWLSEKEPYTSGNRLIDVTNKSLSNKSTKYFNFQNI